MITLNSILLDVYRKIASEAGQISRQAGSATLSSRDVQAAFKIHLPGELGKAAVDSGTKACVHFESSFKNWASCHFYL